MVKLTFDEVRVPLRVVESGKAYVGNTKVALEGIISAYKQGYTPEEIQWCYDPISLGDTYSIIGYYLQRTDEVEAYLREYEIRWNRLVEDAMAQPGARQFYDRLEKIRQEKETDTGLEQG